MTGTASELFDFLENFPSHSIERHEIGYELFYDLRRNVRAIVEGLSQVNDHDSTEIVSKLRSVISEWLTVPIRFDDAALRTLRCMGDSDAVAARWGQDVRGYYEAACMAAEELQEAESPLRTQLLAVIKQLHEHGRSFRIYCHRRSREHFESLNEDLDSAQLDQSAFLHSVASYRVTPPFSVLLKVGPLRPRGWGSAPDALLTAPRFETLVQLTWSGCGDEAGFGYDPVSITMDLDKPKVPIADRSIPALQLEWKVRENLSGYHSLSRMNAQPDLNDFEVFAKLSRTDEVQNAKLVQVDEGHGVLYPPHSRVLGMHSTSCTVDYCLPGETLSEGMYLIIPVLEDANLAELHAEDGYFSQRWKTRLNEEYRSDPNALVNRLSAAGLHLLHLRSGIEHWCKSPTTVIHAPQLDRHFKILIEVLGLDFDKRVTGERRKGSWWQIAWDEVRRARGEAIHVGHEEQQNIDREALDVLRGLLEDIRPNLGQPSFHLAIPKDQKVAGVFRFYRILAIEEGFKAPRTELKMIHELSRIDQWRT